MIKFIAALSGVMVLVTGFLTPAIADTRDCKTITVTRTGGEGGLLYSAKKRARDAWRQKVEENYGKEWSAWYVAKDNGYDCRKNEKGKEVCTAKGSPCKLPIVVKGPGKVCAFYRIEGTGEASKLKGWAQHNSRKVWAKHAKQHYGKKFDTWIISADRRNDCKQNSDGAYVCIAGSKPCQFKLVR